MSADGLRPKHPPNPSTEHNSSADRASADRRASVHAVRQLRLHQLSASLGPAAVWRHLARSIGVRGRTACHQTLIAAPLLLPLACGADPHLAFIPGGASTIDNPSPQLAALLRGAEVAFVGTVRGREAASLVLIRKPTRALPLHRCGAGTEDLLVLLRLRDGVTQLDDQVQVQSCEHGEHLDIDDPESTQQVVSALKIAGSELVLRTRYSFSATPDTTISRRYTIGRRFEPVH